MCIAVGITSGYLLGNQIEVLSDLTMFQTNIPVAILIWLMIYPMVLQIDLASLKCIGILKDEIVSKNNPKENCYTVPRKKRSMRMISRKVAPNGGSTLKF